MAAACTSSRSPVTAAITSAANLEVMNLHLKWIGEAVGPNVHIVLVLDRAGRHVSGRLAVPSNITLHHLPPYSPELNPVENKWGYPKLRIRSGTFSAGPLRSSRVTSATSF